MNKLFIFAAGAAIGSVVTWKLVQTKYEQIANDEIAEMREMYLKREAENAEEESEDEEYSPTDEDVSKLKEVITSNGYTNYSRKNEDEEKEEDEDVNEPYVISPDEFDTMDGYDVVSLTYYADDVLTDERDNVIENPESLVGSDWASHFGEYEDDSVFVRNDDRMCDYEILADTRRYADIHR